MSEPRTLDEIRDTIGTMPFVQAMRLEIDTAGQDIGVVSMPLHRDVSFDGRAFAGVAVATVADVAAGAATFTMIDRDRMPLTVRVDSSITASTRGERLRAESRLRERSGDELTFASVVQVLRDGDWAECGTATVILRVL